MSVSSIFSNAGSSTDPLSALYAPGLTATPASGASGSTSAVTSSALASAASATSLSGSGSLLSQLQQLSSNPAAFKAATADIATQLQTDAQQTGGSQGQALSSLAAKFQSASQTGDLSSLNPAQAHHAGHHHRGGGAAASAASAYQGNTDAFGAATGSGVQSQVSDIISQALTQTSGAPAAIAA